MLTAAGVGSGLDVESLVSQLMLLERRPLNRLERQRSDVELQISANGQLRGAISRLKEAAAALVDSDSLGGVEGSSSNESVLSVSAAPNVQPVAYDVAVTKLATQHRLASSAFVDENTEVGSGDLTVTVGAASMTLTLASGNNTLAQIRDAINAATDNPGVTASLVHVDAGTQLVLTAENSGTANEISLTTADPPLTDPVTPNLDGLTFTQIGTLQDAEFTIDGLPVTRGGNTVSDVIDGVTLTLTGAGNSTISFASDSEKIGEGVKEFVDSYNFMRGNVKALRQNALSGDSVLLNLESRVNAELSSAITLSDDTTAFLFELGVSFNEDGDLEFNESELDALVAADPTRVLDMFAAAQGVATRVDSLLDNYIKDEGIIDSRIEVLESKTRSFDSLIGNAEFRLDKTEERLRAQFTSLDTLISQLTVTSQFLSQQLAGLPQIERLDR